VSEKSISFQRGWADSTPAKTLLVFAAGLTLGISMTVILLEKNSGNFSDSQAVPVTADVSSEKTVLSRK